MSIYIESNNQRILWGMIHKHSLTSRVFTSDHSKQQWFKNIISKVYSGLPSTISREVLLDKNKETLTMMHADLYKLKERLVNSETVSSYKASNESAYSRRALTENRTDALNRDYLDREKQYEQMVQKPPIPEVTFGEKPEDGVIKNMDELIQRQLREREDDIMNITKTFQQNTNIALNKNSIIRINEEIPADLDYIITEEPAKKHVTWDIRTETDDIPSHSHDDIPTHAYDDNKNRTKIYQKFEEKIEELTHNLSSLIDFLELKFPNFIQDYNDFVSENKIHQYSEEGNE
jgi:hypothetical protein